MHFDTLLVSYLLRFCGGFVKLFYDTFLAYCVVKLLGVVNN